MKKELYIIFVLTMMGLGFIAFGALEAGATTSNHIYYILSGLVGATAIFVGKKMMNDIKNYEE